MKCLEKDLLQAYIDGELEIGSRKNIETHIDNCAECKRELAVLKENNDFVFAKLQNYKQHFEESKVPRSPQLELKNKNSNMERVNKNMSMRKRFVAVACAALLVITCITVQPVRAAISSALSIFRVENMEGITVTLEDIQEIQTNLSKGEGEINLDKLGKVKLQGGKSRSATNKDVENLADLDVAFPSTDIGEALSMNVVEPGSVDFTLNTKNVNQIMKSYGATKLLPDDINGKTFKVKIASQVTMNYSVNNEPIVIMQTKSPEIIVPEGVNADEVYNAIVDMPIIPENLQSQLKSIKDWRNTLYIPVADSEMSGVEINGVKGFMTKDYGDTKDDYENAVIWQNKGVIYAVSGKVDEDEILKIARSMR